MSVFVNVQNGGTEPGPPVGDELVEQTSGAGGPT